MSYPKRCSRCRTWKTSDDFEPSGKGRRRGVCRSCRAADAIARYHANPEPLRARARDRYQKRRRMEPEGGTDPGISECTVSSSNRPPNGSRGGKRNRTEPNDCRQDQANESGTGPVEQKREGPSC